MREWPRTLSLSNRIYSLLLYAYPAPFRREYGRHMAQVFRDDTRHTLRESGTAGLVGLWALTLVDLVKTAAAEYLREVFGMTTEGIVRWSGPAAALGAVLFYGSMAVVGVTYGNTVFGTAASVAIVGAVVLSLPMLALGVYGLYRRLPPRTAAANTLAIVAAEVGLLLFIGGILVMFLTDWEAAWEAMIPAGAVLTGLAIAGQGVIALVTRSLGRWSVVPLILGVAHPALMFTAGAGTSPSAVMFSAAVLLIGWVLLGAALWTYQSERGEPGPGLPA